MAVGKSHVMMDLFLYMNPQFELLNSNKISDMYFFKNNTPQWLGRISTMNILFIWIGMLIGICIYDIVFMKFGLVEQLHLPTWDWIALVVAMCSLMLTYRTWRSQEQTRDNTRRLGEDDYRTMLVDSYYNIVRNTINLYSLSVCLKNKYQDYYPSEEYLQKMKLYLFDPNQISFQNIHKNDYGKFQRLAELCHYFNLHIDATQNHLSSDRISVDIKERDMEALIGMHWLLATEIWDTIDSISSEGREEMNRRKICEKIIGISKNFYRGDLHGVSGNKIVGRDVEFLKRVFDGVDGYEDTLKRLDSAIMLKLYCDESGNGQIRMPLIPLHD